MSLYKMCDVSGVSLDGRECAAFFIVPNQPKIYGIPVFGKYDETSGEFTLESDVEKDLFNLMIDSYLTESQMNEQFSDKFAENLLKYPMKINNDIYMFVVQKDVYESLSTIDMDFSYRMRDSILDGIHSVVNLEKGSYDLNKTMLEIMDSTDDDKDRSEYENKFSEEMVVKLEQYKDSDVDLIFDIFDLMRKENKPFSINVVSFVDQYIVKVLFSSELSSKDIIKRLLPMLSFRTTIKTMNPTLQPFYNTRGHQGSSAEFHLYFYKKMVDALEKIVE